MKAIVIPSGVRGTIVAPPSKSAMQRALALALLHNGTTIIENPGISNDDKAAIEIIKSCGAIIKSEATKLIISSKGKVNPGAEIFFGESGLSLRMFAPIIALSEQEVILNGTGSLLKRPVSFFDDLFPLLQIHTLTNDGKLPVKIKGPLKPIDIEIDGSSSSQYLTGLLFAYASRADRHVVIKVNNLKSKPYIELSLQMLTHFGYNVQWQADDHFHVHPVSKKENTIHYFTEGDWSGAAFLLVAGAIAGNINVGGLNIASAQADRAVIDVLKNANAAVEINDNEVRASNANALKAFTFDATHCPDLFPPLAALACYCHGISVISGVSRLAAKESDRAASLIDIVSSMGASIEVEGDDMKITGGIILKGASLHSHHDHRIAMAAAVAALRAEGDTTIEDAEAINKSYPDFYEHLKALGAVLNVEG